MNFRKWAARQAILASHGDSVQDVMWWLGVWLRGSFSECPEVPVLWWQDVRA